MTTSGKLLGTVLRMSFSTEKNMYLVMNIYVASIRKSVPDWVLCCDHHVKTWSERDVIQFFLNLGFKNKIHYFHHLKQILSNDWTCTWWTSKDAMLRKFSFGWVPICVETLAQGFFQHLPRWLIHHIQPSVYNTSNSKKKCLCYFWQELYFSSFSLLRYYEQLTQIPVINYWYSVKVKTKFDVLA